MGFPGGYSGFIICKILFNAAFLLASIRNCICWFLKSIGLADFLDPEIPWSDTPDHAHAVSSVSAEMIRERLPVVTFGILAERFVEFDDVMCAVCLSEFEECEEIRQLTNCSHIFHKSCLDKWLDHDQKTCPLCRSCLLPENFEKEDMATYGQNLPKLFIRINLVQSTFCRVNHAACKYPSSSGHKDIQGWRNMAKICKNIPLYKSGSVQCFKGGTMHSTSFHQNAHKGLQGCWGLFVGCGLYSVSSLLLFIFDHSAQYNNL